MRHGNEVLNWHFKAWHSGNTPSFSSLFPPPPPFLGKQTQGEGRDLELCNDGAQVLVFKFPAVSIIPTSPRLAFQTGFYTLAKCEENFWRD